MNLEDAHKFCERVLYSCKNEEQFELAAKWASYVLWKKYGASVYIAPFSSINKGGIK